MSELAAILEQIREKVRERHPSGTSRDPLPDLLPILHARDAAQGKVASIGHVNPRKGGPVNSVIQAVKRLVSRALDWHVREQVEFNQATVDAIQAILNALETNNRLLAIAPEMRDTIAHWIAWRSEWERKLSANETQFLRSVADLQGAFHHRVTLMEASHRELVSTQHKDFDLALQKNTLEIQDRLWKDLERIKTEYQALIHHELRLIRQKTSGAGPRPAEGPRPDSAVNEETAQAPYDAWAFAERFRGPEDYVKNNQKFYLEHINKEAPIVDLGCGRGEFLTLLQENQIQARGVDSSPDCVNYCQAKGHEVTKGDLFEYLEAEPPESLGTIFCCQVVEHLPRHRVPELIRLAHSRLRRGGVLAIETPNPECLAIFATHFYLDPTHQHPIPPDLLAFYFQEAGFEIKVHRFAQAVESMPELAALPDELRNRFFGALDYAVLGTRV